MIRYANIPGGEICGLSTDELEFVTRESSMRYVLEIDNLDASSSSNGLPELSSEDLEMLDRIESESVPKSTEMQRKLHVARFRQFLNEKELCQEFERVPDRFLNNYLRLFYSSLRKQVNIITGESFKRCNGVLVAMVKKYMEGHAEKQDKYEAISEDDMRTIRAYFDRTSLRKLQDENIFNILFHFALRGRENLRELTPGCFEIVSEGGTEFVHIAVAMLSKNVKASLNEKAFNDLKLARMYNLQDKAACPVEAFKMYGSKLPNGCEVLFPRLNKSGFSACQRLGKDSLGDFMKNLSACLDLQRKYTNHCVRVTTVNCLARAGFDNQAITLMTGHKNSSSVDVYKRRDTDCVARMSACLAAYGSKVARIDDDAESTIESVTTGFDRGNLMKAPEGGQVDLPRSLYGGQFHNCTFNFTESKTSDSVCPHELFVTETLSSLLLLLFSVLIAKYIRRKSGNNLKKPANN